MFKVQGTCYHTGYKPTFTEPATPREPEAFTRSRAALALSEKKDAMKTAIDIHKTRMNGTQ